MFSDRFAKNSVKGGVVRFWICCMASGSVLTANAISPRKNDMMRVSSDRLHIRRCSSLLMENPRPAQAEKTRSRPVIFSKSRRILLPGTGRFLCRHISVILHPPGFSALPEEVCIAEIHVLSSAVQAVVSVPFP